MDELGDRFRVGLQDLGDPEPAFSRTEYVEDRED
jgi:hypothetical protein